MPQFTPWNVPSPAPNVLYNPAAVDQAANETIKGQIANAYAPQRNQLLPRYRRHRQSVRDAEEPVGNPVAAPATRAGPEPEPRSDHAALLGRRDATGNHRGRRRQHDRDGGRPDSRLGGARWPDQARDATGRRHRLRRQRAARKQGQSVHRRGRRGGLARDFSMERRSARGVQGRQRRAAAGADQSRQATRFRRLRTARPEFDRCRPDHGRARRRRQSRAGVGGVSAAQGHGAGNAAALGHGATARAGVGRPGHPWQPPWQRPCSPLASPPTAVGPAIGAPGGPNITPGMSDQAWLDEMAKRYPAMAGPNERHIAAIRSATAQAAPGDRAGLRHPIRSPPSAPVARAAGTRGTWRQAIHRSPADGTPQVAGSAETRRRHPTSRPARDQGPPATSTRAGTNGRAGSDRRPAAHGGRAERHGPPGGSAGAAVATAGDANRVAGQPDAQGPGHPAGGEGGGGQSEAPRATAAADGQRGADPGGAIPPDDREVGRPGQTAAALCL